jgi:CspA family cold shock protein
LYANNIVGHRMDDSLRDGQEIRLETERTEKGLSAVNASPIKDTAGGTV